MSRWAPRATVATVVFDGSRYLLVEERDKASGARVFNQPAGHLERGEGLAEAALREHAAQKIADAMLGAQRNLQPARLGVGQTALPNVTCNRRAYVSPYDNASSVDPLLGVLRVDAAAANADGDGDGDARRSA